MQQATSTLTPSSNASSFIPLRLPQPQPSFLEGLNGFIPKLCNWATPDAWYKVKDAVPFLGSTPLVKSVREMAGGAKVDSKQVVKAFKSPEFHHLRIYLVKIFAAMPDKKLNKLLHALFYEQATENPTLLIRRLKSLLTQQKVEAAVHSEFEAFKTAKDTAMAKAGSAKRELDAKLDEKRNSIRRLISHYTLNTLDWIIDTLMYAFQLKDLNDGDATKVERQMIASMRWQAFRDNVTVISGWLIALTLYTGSALSAATIAGSVTLMTVLLGTLYLRYLKRCPEDLHPMTNLSTLAQHDLLPNILGRDSEINEIFNLWEMNKTTKGRKKFSLLTGPSGAGKSGIPTRMAWMIARGQCPEFLKGAQVYQVNAAKLITGYGDTEHLELVEKNIKGFEGQAIIFIDEVHVAFDDKKRKVLADQLKTLMDPTSGFNYLIFATTEGEYIEYIESDKAFNRRVEKSEVQPTSEEDTRMILSDLVKNEAQDLTIPPEVIHAASYLSKSKHADIFKDCPQPMTSKDILLEAMSRARVCRLQEQTVALQKLKDALYLQDMERHPLPYSAEGLAQSEAIKDLEGRIAEQEKLIKAENEQREGFGILIDHAANLEEKIKKLTVEIKQDADQKKPIEDKLFTFLMLLNYLQPAFQRVVDEERKSHPEVSPEITLEDIEKFIEEKAAKIQKEKEVEQRLKAEKKDKKKETV